MRSSSCDTIFKVILAQRKRHSSSLFDTKTDSLEQCMTNDISMIMIIHVLIVEINIHLYYLYIPSLGLVTTAVIFSYLGDKQVCQGAGSLANLTSKFFQIVVQLELSLTL